MDMYKQGLLGINSYPIVFLRRWGECLALPQRRQGPFGPHNTTVHNASCKLSCSLIQKQIENENVEQDNYL